MIRLKRRIKNYFIIIIGSLFIFCVLQNVIYLLRRLVRTNDPRSYCAMNFTGYNNTYARLSNVVINPAHGYGRVGGEHILDVLNQSESLEYYKLNPGYFEFVCNETVDYKFRQDVHLSKWRSSLISSKIMPPFYYTVKGWTIAVTRFEYANYYHTMTDFYNSFRLMKIFNIKHNNLTILFIDGHPHGNLDHTWTVLFGKVIRAGVLTKSVLFEKLIWGISGYDSVMNIHSSNNLPLVEEFKQFMLRRHSIMTERILNCQRLNVVVIVRRDYVAHPRNPTGKISRKIKNEIEFLDAIKTSLPGHSVQSSQIDTLDMRAQLELITSTDILVGMHGAGLTHTLFLPRHAGLVELFPDYWYDRHFRAIAKWRRLRYSFWKNEDAERELPDYFTVVDEKQIAEMVLKMANDICS